MSERIIGYALLVVGLILIFAPLWSVYQVFTGQKKPVQLFQFNGISLDPSQFMNLEVPQELSDSGVKLESSSKPQDIIPPNLINDTSNIFAHVVLMGFVASIGFRIASLGTQLMRPIIVKGNLPLAKVGKPSSPKTSV